MSFFSLCLRVITANALKPSHVITCVPEQDFLTIAISNIDHVVYEDGKQSTNYNFKTVERQIIDRFFTGKPTIEVTVSYFKATFTFQKIRYSAVKFLMTLHKAAKFAPVCTIIQCHHNHTNYKRHRNTSSSHTYTSQEVLINFL